jgi:6-phosphogluconate dehydrogenase-like protein
MKVGFLGLARMGSSIAANILAAGHDLAVWNGSKENAEPLVRQGAATGAYAESGLFVRVASRLSERILSSGKGASLGMKRVTIPPLGGRHAETPAVGPIEV